MTASKLEKATFGGGCFWCIEAAFERLDGVLSVVPGYSGGETESPSYEEVCRGDTGHAEVVQITFDSERIDFQRLLDVFFAVHDPTTRDRQGHDVGSQYRSIILHHTPEQRSEAERSIARLESLDAFGAPIVTQLMPMDIFYPAEDYHRRYFQQHPEQAYCQVVIAPKLAKLRLQIAQGRLRVAQKE